MKQTPRQLAFATGEKSGIDILDLSTAKTEKTALTQ